MGSAPVPRCSRNQTAEAITPHLQFAHAIPALNGDGLLPVGLHACTLPEVPARFGAFQGSDQRSRLCLQLADLVSAMRRCGFIEALVLDGSFVTAKAAPNDIDLLAVLRPGHDFERDLPMPEYALVSRSILRRRYGFDVIVAERDSQLYRRHVDFFSRVRDNPSATKGLLRVSL